MMTKTFLRVKRRRTEEALPYIRLEALNRPGELPYQLSHKKRNRPQGDGRIADLDASNLSDFLDDHHGAPPVHRRTSASVLWKRLEPQQEETESCRFVDAMLENEDGEARSNKRRKLTLLDPKTQVAQASGNVKRKVPLKVLDPLTRIVDDSLQQVHAGMKPISEHYRMITTDRRLSASHDPKKWLSWCHSSGGNLLHACALWNDTEMAGDLLQIPSLAETLCEGLDGDARTPYEVAQLSGHDSVCEVLEAFGGDTTNYVYDIFCLEEADNETTNDKDSPLTVELTSGVAYWTPDGELMLEPNDKISSYIDDHDDDEIDSNCEDYDANDYPDDEEDDDVAWGYDDHSRNFLTGDSIIDHNQEPCSLDRLYLQGKQKHQIYVNDGDDSDDLQSGGYGDF